MRLIFGLLLFAMVGCNVRSEHKASFERVPLDGGELASLLNLNCAKFTYRGPEMWCHWRIVAKHYGPDDKLVDETDLGGGGCSIQPGESFYCSIPIHDGGTAAIRFFGMVTNKHIEPLLPKRKSRSSVAWNSELEFDGASPMIFAIYTVDSEHTALIPNFEIPPGLGGEVVAIALELVESERGSSYPWNKPGDAP